MRVEVRLFGGLADRAGTARLPVDLPEGATVRALREAVAAACPDVAGLLARVSVAVNHEVVGAGRRVEPGDEVALLPPAAGGGPAVLVGLRQPPLPVEEALAAVAHPAAGATVSFLGTVRDHAPGMAEVERLHYSAYGEMAERILGEVAEEVLERWPEVRGVALLHAVGDLPVGTHTILVACSAPHREAAFAACRHALEEVKARVPVWKREEGPAGTRWVGLEAGPDAG